MKTMDRETPGSEYEALQRIFHLVRQAEKDEAELDELFAVAPGSSFGKDNEALPELNPSEYAHAKLTYAHGHLAAFARWLGIEGDNEAYTVQALPFGGYALLRTAIECAAEALWVMKPPARQNRLRRRLMVHASEILMSESFLKSSRSKNLGQIEARTARLNEITEKLDLGEHCWSPWKETRSGKRDSKLAPISNMLADVEKMRDPKALGFESTVSFESAWRASSGLAHGQSWPIFTLNDTERVPGTQAQGSAEHRIFADFKALAIVTHAACDLLATAFDRADQLANVTRK